ncbi:MAG: cysteine--tRNA ligase [Candidatus Cloacimonetes bacterium]|nr:cysteine--tRNA ligase [Candidatus Cloacimonadota bacterium]
MKIYNTLSRQKEEFIPVEAGKVKMYNCGPTVYNYFHIGNARNLVVFDVIRRYFQFRGYEVSYAQNITDIDDKIIAQSITEGIPTDEVTRKYITAFLEDLDKLDVNPPDYQPRATQYISQMINFIRALEEKGYAYEAEGDVYFAVEKFAAYGKLSGKKLVDLKVGARVEENEQKRYPFDFTLWKKAKPGEPKWQSPWGEGRPGWHTECVVMSRDLLGETFDIHGGGNDLVFPHHENEIAQGEAYCGHPTVNYWLHNGFLNIEGEKMSKSAGNFFIARDVLQKYPAEAIRYFFLSKHYRSPIDFNEEIIQQSLAAVKTLYSALKDVDYLNQQDLPEYSEAQQKLKEQFLDVMDDDFNTARAIALLFEAGKEARNKDNSEEDRLRFARLLVELGSVLGFFRNLAEKLSAGEDISGKTASLIELLLTYRQDFKKEKNWQWADKIRNDLKELGINLKDTPQGTEWGIDENAKV